MQKSTIDNLGKMDYIIVCGHYQKHQVGKLNTIFCEFRVSKLTFDLPWVNKPWEYPTLPNYLQDEHTEKLT